jgi:tetratricopeptide (TPR) repeat protein
MHQRGTHPQPVRPAKPVIEHLPAISVGALSAMSVLPHLVPSDTAAAQWNNVAAIMLWLLLLIGWALAGVLRGKAALVMDRTTALVLVLTLLPGLSACVLVFRTDGNARLAMNLGWQWATFGIAYFLSRQWLKNAADVRALVAVMIATAVGLSAYALFQFTVSMPQTRLEYARNPARVRAEAGLLAPEDSPLVKHFEDRLASTEPTATFALTNSLAGMLTPWLVLLCALASYGVATRRYELTWRGLTLAAIIAIAFVLTKSRTATLAVIVGVALALLYATPLGRRVDGRLLLALGVIGTVAITGGIVSGALDVEVLSEAPKSVLYRFQYWEATAGMIRDYPIFGAGPGNFQDTYKHYQLPEASENIADPHNFVLEIWSTAGTLALIALLALVASFAWDFRRRKPDDESIVSSFAPLTAPLGAHAMGALVGVGLGYGCGFLSDLMPAPALLLTAVPAGALTLWLLRGWVADGKVTTAMLVAPLVALLLNLLASGGISFPGVATSLWLLVAMVQVIHTSAQGEMDRNLSRSAAAGWLAVAVLAGVLYHYTVYNPVFRSSVNLSEATLAIRNGELKESIAYAMEAARVDPWSPQPWVSADDSLVDLSDLWHSRLAREGDSDELRKEFTLACDAGLARDPRSESVYAQIANRRLYLYRQFGKPADLTAARYYYECAASRYPNNAFVHAQLAWLLHLTGDDDAAAKEAEIALALDQRHDHQEHKLAKLHVIDAAPAKGLDQLAPPPADETAEPLMQRLRTASNSSGANP